MTFQKRFFNFVLCHCRSVDSVLELIVESKTRRIMERMMKFTVIFFFLFSLGFMSCEKEKICEAEYVKINKLEGRGDDPSITYDMVVEFKDTTVTMEDDKDPKPDGWAVIELNDIYTKDSKPSDVGQDHCDGYPNDEDNPVDAKPVIDRWYECFESRETAHGDGTGGSGIDGGIIKVHEETCEEL